MAAMSAKFYYDRKHTTAYLRPGDWVNLRLHRGYNIANNTRKLGRQYAGPFQIIEKVGRLAYRLKLPNHWRIHPVISVAHLESVPSPYEDPYNRPRPKEPGPVYVEGDTDNNKSYEVSQILDKRVTPSVCIKYLIQWKGYGPEHDMWYYESRLGNCKELVKEYENLQNK
ncbi:hypothetical protein K3495_g15474 [Podosphaera aphanis]|nr:hypothetical protein K3495_g15474 [Podosphaera aphanis]